MDHLAEILILTGALVVVIAVVFPRARKTVLAALDARIQAVRNELDEAQDLFSEAQEKMSQTQTHMDQQEERLSEITSGSRRDVRAYRTRVRKEVAQALSRRQEAIEGLVTREQQQALRDIRQAVALQIIAAAKQVVCTHDQGQQGLMKAALENAVAVATAESSAPAPRK